MDRSVIGAPTPSEETIAHLLAVILLGGPERVKPLNDTNVASLIVVISTDRGRRDTATSADSSSGVQFRVTTPKLIAG